jgi:putative glycosyltransferase (TIGR04372 family)
VIGALSSESTMILRPQPKEGNKRMLSGRLCVLRRGRRHIVLIRPNPLQFGHLGLEIMFGVKLAKRFRAPLYIIRPDQVVNTALYELVVDGVTFNVVEGWRATLLTWIFFSGGALSVKDKPVPYASPIGYLLTYRFLRLNKFVVTGLWHKLGPVWRRPQLYMRWALRYPRAAVHIAKRIMGIGIRLIRNGFPLDPDFVGPVPIRIRTEPTRLNPSYGRRLWVDDVGSFRITLDRLPMLRNKAEREFNILPDTRLVSLHMRESGFKAGREIHELKPLKRRDDSTRNVSFASYHLAIDYLRERGYTVVRIGDRTMTPIGYPGIVDLATSPERTDLFEFYCIARSDFFIGCESGPSTIAWMSGVPVVTLNATEPWSAYPVREFDTFALKVVLDKLKAYTLSPLDMLTLDYANNARNTERFEYGDNKPEDILDAIRDMVDIVERGVQPETPEQRAFRLRVTSFCLRARAENSTINKHGAHHGFIGRGRISASFARKYIAPELKWRDVVEAAAERCVGAA